MSRSLFKTGGSTISSFSTVVGITLVLTMVGILFIFLLVANAVTEHFKEQLTVQLFIKETQQQGGICGFFPTSNAATSTQIQQGGICGNRIHVYDIICDSLFCHTHIVSALQYMYRAERRVYSIAGDSRD